jgi:hypothetical protein
MTTRHPSQLALLGEFMCLLGVRITRSLMGIADPGVIRQFCSVADMGAAP